MPPAMTNEPYKLPQPADKPIRIVLEEFFDEQRARLKPATARQYRDGIELFQLFLNDYGPNHLDEAETALFEQHRYTADGDDRDFCDIFGPEKIPDQASEFLGYFMVRKVIASKQTMAAAGRTIKKLGKWLQQKGYIDADSAKAMAERGGDSARDLPRAQNLAEMLQSAADFSMVDPDADEVIEDHFTVEAVEDCWLTLSPMMERGRYQVPVPHAASEQCQVGWDISGVIAKGPEGWQFVEVWNVYP